MRRGNPAHRGKQLSGAAGGPVRKSGLPVSNAAFCCAASVYLTMFVSLSHATLEGSARRFGVMATNLSTGRELWLTGICIRR
ncbi:patatin family protein|nr:patatin family protein [Candidatus Pantoea persica]